MLVSVSNFLCDYSFVFYLSIYVLWARFLIKFFLPPTVSGSSIYVSLWIWIRMHLNNGLEVTVITHPDAEVWHLAGTAFLLEKKKKKKGLSTKMTFRMAKCFWIWSQCSVMIISTQLYLMICFVVNLLLGYQRISAPPGFGEWVTALQWIVLVTAELLHCFAEPL